LRRKTQFVVDGQWQDGDNHNLQLPPATAMWSLPLTVGGATKVPSNIMGMRAYVMWEDAGQPDGVDFGMAAEAELRSLMYAGIMPADVKLHFETANGE
jgi:hypothetical protein